MAGINGSVWAARAFMSRLIKLQRQLWNIHTYITTYNPGTKPTLPELLKFTCTDGRAINIPVKIATKYICKFGNFLLDDRTGSRVKFIWLASTWMMLKKSTQKSFRNSWLEEASSQWPGQLLLRSYMTLNCLPLLVKLKLPNVQQEQFDCYSLTLVTLCIGCHYCRKFACVHPLYYSCYM